MATAEVVAPVLAAGREIAARLTPETRKAILRVKGVLCTHPEYRRRFRSTDIYEAVLSGGVRTVPDWWTWLESRREAAL
ncbi:MAG: hypothetical protein MUE73_17755 [Planctomycetes bacterium]|nr:hypothetical protein [Planctomycetota bacterium]